MHAPCRYAEVRSWVSERAEGVFTPRARRLFAGQAAAQTGDGLAQAAFAQLVVFEVSRGSTPAAIAQVLAATLLPYSLLGPVAGVAIDRTDRRKVLAASAALRAGLVLLGIAAWAARSTPLALFLVLSITSVGRFLLAAKSAALPRAIGLSEELPAGEAPSLEGDPGFEEAQGQGPRPSPAASPGGARGSYEGDAKLSLLARANGFSAGLGVVSVFVGAIMGTASVAISTPLAFALSSAWYLAASALFASLGELPPVGRARSAGKIIPTVISGVKEELKRASRGEIGLPLASLAWHRVALGATVIGAVLVADSEYGLELPGYTGALVVAGAAALGGSAVAPLILRRATFRGVCALSFGVAGLGAFAAVVDRRLVTMAAVVAGSSFAFQVLKVGVDSVLQERAPDLVRGRVFSLQDTAYNASFVLGAAMLVPVWSRLPPAAAFAVSAGMFTAAGVVTGASALRAGRRDRDGSGRQSRAGSYSPKASPKASTLTEFGRGRSPSHSEGSRAWLAVGILSASVGALSFPRPSWWPLAFVFLVPLVVGISLAASQTRAGLVAWAAGAGFFLVSHYWMAHKTLYFQPVIAALFGLTWVPWALVARAALVRGRWVVAMVGGPSLWVLAEYVRSWSVLGGPWALLGASQWRTPWGLEAASWGGVWLVGWLLVLANVALASIVLKALGDRQEHSCIDQESGPRARAQVAAVLGVVTMVGYAWASYDPQRVSGDERVLRIAGVQPGVIDPAEERFAAGEALTYGLRGDFDLVVWGESSLGEDPFLRPEYMERLRRLSSTLGAPLLVNVDARTERGSIYKTALLVSEEGPRARYDKRRLVPFGEYVPLRPLMGWVTRFTDAAREDRGRGTSDVVMDVPGTTEASIAPLVCFESAFPDMSRQLAKLGADVIVVQSANTTFQESWLPDQHASLAAMRAAESGRPVVHATISGVSAAFDAYGRRLAWVDANHVGSWAAEVPLGSRRTLYASLGDWVPVASACGVLALAFLIAGPKSRVFRRSRA